MHNFKKISGLIICTVLCVSCLDTPQTGFVNSTNLNQQNQVEFQPIHQLKLTVSDLHKEIDESGFSPILKSHFQLKNLQDGQWPQAWVVFSINVFLKDLKVLSTTQSQALQNNSLRVDFEQTLPNFGIKKDELTIRVTPIAWMPTFPLHFSDKTPSNMPNQNQPLKSTSSALPSLSINY